MAHTPGSTTPGAFRLPRRRPLRFSTPLVPHVPATHMTSASTSSTRVEHSFQRRSGLSAGSNESKTTRRLLWRCWPRWRSWASSHGVVPTLPVTSRRPARCHFDTDTDNATLRRRTPTRCGRPWSTRTPAFLPSGRVPRQGQPCTFLGSLIRGDPVLRREVIRPTWRDSQPPDDVARGGVLTRGDRLRLLAGNPDNPEPIFYAYAYPRPRATRQRRWHPAPAGCRPPASSSLPHATRSAMFPTLMPHSPAFASPPMPPPPISPGGMTPFCATTPTGSVLRAPADAERPLGCVARSPPSWGHGPITFRPTATSTLSNITSHSRRGRRADGDRCGVGLHPAAGLAQPAASSPTWAGVIGRGGRPSATSRPKPTPTPPTRPRAGPCRPAAADATVLGSRYN